MERSFVEGLPRWPTQIASPVAEPWRRNGLSQAFKVLAAIGAVCAWATLGYGLFGTTVNRPYADDLEAGGRFGVAFALYWPFYGLTVPMVTSAVLGLLPRPTSLIPLAAGLGVSTLFLTWLMAVNENVFRHDLLTFVFWAQLINLAALVFLCLAWLTQRDGRRTD